MSTTTIITWFRERRAERGRWTEACKSIGQHSCAAAVCLCVSVSCVSDTSIVHSGKTPSPTCHLLPFCLSMSCPRCIVASSVEPKGFSGSHFRLSEFFGEYGPISCARVFAGKRIWRCFAFFTLYISDTRSFCFVGIQGISSFVRVSFAVLILRRSSESFGFFLLFWPFKQARQQLQPDDERDEFIWERRDYFMYQIHERGFVGRNPTI
jgi:hypothetical protein